MRKEQMVQKKRFPHISLENGLANTPKTGVSRRKRSETDDKHWDFLDEIEAPLWVDLTLECQSGYNDKDDEWFHVNHPFHQCSSKQLISTFARPLEDHMNLELDIPEQSSPKLPPSVSKSRGDDYRRWDRVWGNQMGTLSNQHPVKNLNKKSTFVSSGSTRMTGCKTSQGRRMELPSNSDSRGESSLTENAEQNDIRTVKNLSKKSSFVNSGSTRMTGSTKTSQGRRMELPTNSDSRGQSSLTEIAEEHDIRTVPPFNDQKFTSDSNFSRKRESSSSSTITSEGREKQQQNSLEVSSHVFGETRGFLSALKVSLRKSCVTRQASRVEVTNGRLSEGQKASSSKSSVGSSSNLGYDGKPRDNKDMTPDSRNVKIPVARHQKLHEANLFTAPGVRPHYTIRNPKLRSQSFKSPSINQGNTKVKFQQQTLHAKVLVPHGVNKTYPPAAAVKVKAVASSSGRIPGGGKENLAGKVAPSQKSSTGNTMQVQKVTTRVPEKSARTTLVVQKEKINDRRKVKKSGTMAEKVYFR